jgi:Rod binding domain-containing protein
VGYPKLDPSHVIPDESTDSALRQAVAIRRLKERIKPGEDETKELKAACQDFEAVFISKIWKQMRDSLPKEGYLHSKEEGMYLSMFDWEMSRKMSVAGGIGLGDMLFEQLSQTLRSAGSHTGGPPPRVPEGVPVNRGGLAANSESGPAPNTSLQAQFEDQELMSRVNALARAIETGGQGVQAVSQQIAPQPRVSGYQSSPAPDLVWPLSGMGAAGSEAADVTVARNGVAMSAHDGAAVRAAMPGKVSFAGHVEGLGNTIIIDHPGGWQSVYANVAANHVAEGVVVRAGREIAMLGKQGRPEQPELHFQLRKDGRKLDPEELMQMLQASRITGKTA